MRHAHVSLFFAKRRVAVVSTENFVRIVNREIDLAMLPINEVPPRFEARRLYDEDFVVAPRSDRGCVLCRGASLGFAQR
jgi:DNA-binding transcriptional LysR family regulator